MVLTLSYPLFPVYGTFVAVAAVFLLMRGVVFAIGSWKASITHHHNIVDGVLHAPSSFFDATPIGRVLNRFLKVRKRLLCVASPHVQY